LLDDTEGKLGDLLLGRKRVRRREGGREKGREGGRRKRRIGERGEW